jgi:hypothetical protein
LSKKRSPPSDLVTVELTAVGRAVIRGVVAAVTTHLTQLRPALVSLSGLSQANVRASALPHADPSRDVGERRGRRNAGSGRVGHITLADNPA